MKLFIGYLLYIIEEVVELFNWFVIGFFFNLDWAGLSIIYLLEEGFVFGCLYEYGGQEIVWQLLKVEILVDVIDVDLFWGMFYDWNYYMVGYVWVI